MSGSRAGLGLHSMKLVSWCADVAPFLCGSPRDILVGHSELRGSSKLSPHEGIVSESLEPLLASSLIPVRDTPS